VLTISTLANSREAFGSCLAHVGEAPPARFLAWRVRDLTSEVSEMCGATGIRAAQTSLTLTLPNQPSDKVAGARRASL